MPFRAPPAPQCPICNQRVYAAEERKANGYSYHKHCFICEVCRKSLDSTTLAEHGFHLYCKTCHGAQFGTKGYGYGVGAGCLNLNDGAHLGLPGQQSMGGMTAEQMMNGGGMYTSTVTARVNPGNVTPAGPGQEACPRCGGAVYQAERVLGADRGWHKRCFICSICGCSLSSGKCNDRDGDIFCNVCYGQYFSTRAMEAAGGIQMVGGAPINQYQQQQNYNAGGYNVAYSGTTGFNLGQNTNQGGYNNAGGNPQMGGYNNGGYNPGYNNQSHNNQQGYNGYQQY